MPLHYEAYRRTLAEAGIGLTEADYYGNVGGTWRETIPKFLRGRACPWSPTEIHDRKQQTVLAVMQTVEIPQLAVAKLLPLLHKRVKLAIASSGSRATIELVVGRLGWTPLFDVIVTGEDVAHGKPAPDLFLLAAQRMGEWPSKCMVFEDTDDGIAAAIAAGMATFDVRKAHAAR